jgi:8-oxo-dGTP pyrophosphatase MutT (NUDIX family)
MEEEWIRDRALLRGLLTRHPDWTRQHYAEAVGRSVSSGEEMAQTLVRGRSP